MVITMTYTIHSLEANFNHLSKETIVYICLDISELFYHQAYHPYWYPDLTSLFKNMLKFRLIFSFYRNLSYFVYSMYFFLMSYNTFGMTESYTELFEGFSVL